MPYTVLIADDAVFMRVMLRDILTEGGFEIVAEASDGIEAAELARELDPDLVTLDIVMPRRNGLVALGEMMEDRPGRAVVMCSALGQEALVMQALEAGARDFVVKPFEAEHVLAVMKKAVQASQES